MSRAHYYLLTQYLSNSSEDTIVLGFSDIERIIGDKLPASFYTHSQVIWNNGNQNYALNWLRAGYVVKQYNITQRFAVFVKDVSLANDYLSRCGKKSNGAQHLSRSIRIQDKAASVSCTELIGLSEEYFSAIQKDDHARYLSWEHCYRFFQNNRHNPSPEQLDLLCLHLAWYLASWGMLRGGAFLLQKDYLVHMPVVKLLTSPEYEDMYSPTASKLSNPLFIKRICRLAESITEIYKEERSKDESGEKTASETLVTKILLGTMGCTPAYDRYFKLGLSKSSVAQQHFGEASLTQLAKFYRDNYEEFEKHRFEICEGRIEYPPMKIIDMCFWQMGFKSE